MLSKRLKYFISSVLAAGSFYLLLTLPYESIYYGLATGIVLTVFLFWFGLGIVFTNSLYTRIMSVLLPVAFFVGFGLFAALLPFSIIGTLLLSFAWGIVCYVMFLVENVFLVAIGYKTVPLYRAAYTVSLIIMLAASFLLFDSMYSFRFPFWVNVGLVFVISVIIFLYQFWAIAIELPDDGKDKSLAAYVLIPSLILSELTLVFSFWPVGIFKGSIYLVGGIYIISGLLQADIRERLFRRTWLTFSWIALAVLLGVVVITKWN